MCEYCTPNEYGNCKNLITVSNGDGVYIFNSGYENYLMENIYTANNKIIYYCPICGQSLTEV